MQRLAPGLVFLACVAVLASQDSGTSKTEWVSDPSHASRIAAVESDIVTAVPGEAEPLRVTLRRLMELYKSRG